MFQTVLTALVLGAGTVDLPAGTVLCGSENAAREFVEAQAAKDTNRLHWLLGSACYDLRVSFNNQTVLSAESEFLKVEWSNGVFRKERFVVKTS